jgi:pantetheine-phosphate adenylyltransferase/8-oxo-dGTP diphosphatase
MKAVYPGSFDPFTNGHLEILNQAIPLFSKITLAVAVNPEKPNSMFGLEDRLAFLRDIASEAMDSEKIEQYFSGTSACIQIAVGSYPVKGPGALYTVDYAESVGATHIIRGLRNGSDFEYEFAMAQINKGLNPKIRTVFFMADTDVSSVSSSMVRGLIGPQGWENAVKEYLPMCMWERFFKLVV